MTESDTAPDVVAVEDLYQLRPDAFIAARDALAKTLRADGDRDASDAIKRLRKPPVTAWVVNRLSADEPDAIGELFAANDRLRAAMAGSGAKTRELFRAASEERQRIVSRLAERARQILEDEDLGAGRANLDRITTTLMATATDPAGADLVRTRMLDHDLDPGGGFGVVLDASPADAVPAVPKPAPGASAKPATSPDPAREKTERKQRERAERDAEDRAAQAKDAERIAAAAQHEAEDVEREAERITRIAVAKRREADRARREADRAHERARTALERLDVARPSE